MLAFICEFRIDLISNCIDTAFLDQRNDLLVVFVIHDAAGRIAREVQDDRLGLITYRLA